MPVRDRRARSTAFVTAIAATLAALVLFIWGQHREEDARRRAAYVARLERMEDALLDFVRVLDAVETRKRGATLRERLALTDAERRFYTLAGPRLLSRDTSASAVASLMFQVRLWIGAGIPVFVYHGERRPIFSFETFREALAADALDFFAFVRRTRNSPIPDRWGSTALGMIVAIFIVLLVTWAFVLIPPRS